MIRFVTRYLFEVLVKLGFIREFIPEKLTRTNCIHADGGHIDECDKFRNVRKARMLFPTVSSNILMKLMITFDTVRHKISIWAARKTWIYSSIYSRNLPRTNCLHADGKHIDEVDQFRKGSNARMLFLTGPI